MIRGQVRKTVPPKVEREIRTSIHNRFDIEVVDSRTGNVRQRVQGKNVICNQMWTYMLTNNVTWNNYIHYGTGTGTPSTADTSLFAFAGYLQSSIDSVSFDWDTKVLTVRKRVQMAETVSVGKTLTEIGIAQGSGAATLCTHAMLKDMNGNTISIEKTDTDIINIYATVYVHFVVPFGTTMCGSYFYNSSNGAWQIMSRFAGISNNNCFAVGAGYGITARNTAKTTGAAGVGNASEKTLKFTMNRWGVNDQNLGGTKVLFLGGCGGTSDTTWWRPFEFAFEVCDGNGWYEKSTISGESLGSGDGTKTDFATRFPWAKNAKVFVNGVETPVTVDYRDHKRVGGLANYFKFIGARKQGVGGFSSVNATISYARAADDQIFLMPNSSSDPNDWPVLENTLWETVGIESMYYYSTSSSYNIGRTQCSNDLENWIELSVTNGRYEVPSEYQNYRYWRFYGDTLINSGGPQWRHTIKANASMPSAYNVHFNEPPAADSVITIDYDCDCIAKDANHVFDFSVTFRFNEYNEG